MTSEKVEYKSVWCKYVYKPDELRDIAETLAIKTQDKNAMEGEKKSVISSYKERIESIDVEIISAARKYKDRYEMKDIECFVERDFEQGIVKYIRTDNGEIAQTQKMTMAERQKTVMEAEAEVLKVTPEEEADLILREMATAATQRDMTAETSSL
jgi:hypothetical protein